jgi:hypothetical protein
VEEQRQREEQGFQYQEKSNIGVCKAMDHWALRRQKAGTIRTQNIRKGCGCRGVCPRRKAKEAPPFAAQRMGHPGLHRTQPDGRVVLLAGGGQQH